MNRPEDAADELWPVIVGGRYEDVVQAFRKRDEQWTALVATERDACALIADRAAFAPTGRDASEIAAAIRARGRG